MHTHRTGSDRSSDGLDLQTHHGKTGIQDLRRRIHRRHNDAQLCGDRQCDNSAVTVQHHIRDRSRTLPGERYRAHTEYFRERVQTEPAQYKHIAVLCRTASDRIQHFIPGIERKPDHDQNLYIRSGWNFGSNAGVHRQACEYDSGALRPA